METLEHSWSGLFQKNSLKNVSQLLTSFQHDPVPSRPIKPKVALRLKHHDLDITFYNGCDKYLLCTVLKELNSDDR